MARKDNLSKLTIDTAGHLRATQSYGVTNGKSFMAISNFGVHLHSNAESYTLLVKHSPEKSPTARPLEIVRALGNRE
jgi:hypothetical protein